MMKCKRVLLLLLICLTGIAAMAQNDGIVLNKSVSNQIWNKTTESKLTLEAYATGEVVITETMEQTPCDIVLVLDVSGSMEDDISGGCKMDILKEAVCNFICIVADSAIKYNIDHKISIVKFALDDYYDSESSLTEGNETYEYPWYYFVDDDDNYTQVVKNLKDVRTVSNVDDLKNAVQKLEPGGATAADYGMTKVKYIYGAGNSAYVPGTAEKKRNKVVILFTDGDPTYNDGFETAVANNTIAAAKVLKDSGAVVYTVGVFNNIDEDEYKYMSYVSSKYPSAVSMTNSGNDSAVADYFFNATTAEGLTGVFENIAKQTPSGGAVISDLTESTVIKDVITKYFKLPEPANASDIKVYTADYNAVSATFLAPEINPNVSVSLADNNKTINVNGFNFSEHWCGPNAPSGQKLIIEIPIVFNNVPEGKSFDWTHVPTNEDESAIYASDGTLIKRFPVPYADLSAVVLPIELIAFQAECMDNAIQFTWSTATETNNEYFTIERSEDAVHYTEVARVQGAGTSAFRQDYSFMADNTTNKTMYYRLRQTDIDGTTEAFSPIAVQCGTTGKTDVVMYPMPATDRLHIVSGEEISHVQFYNVYGDYVKQVQVNADNAHVDITDLPCGIYMLKISMCDGKTIIGKIVKSIYQH